MPGDVRATTELFQAFGYTAVLPGLGDYESADQIRRKLTHWSSDADLTADDVVVVYFAGHGSVEERDRHYLLWRDSQEDDLVSSALWTDGRSCSPEAMTERCVSGTHAMAPSSVRR